MTCGDSATILFIPDVLHFIYLARDIESHTVALVIPNHCGKLWERAPQNGVPSCHKSNANAL